MAILAVKLYAEYNNIQFAGGRDKHFYIVYFDFE